jgi:hypothetical protein
MPRCFVTYETREHWCELYLVKYALEPYYPRTLCDNTAVVFEPQRNTTHSVLKQQRVAHDSVLVTGSTMNITQAPNLKGIAPLQSQAPLLVITQYMPMVTQTPPQWQPAQHSARAPERADSAVAPERQSARAPRRHSARRVPSWRPA